MTAAGPHLDGMAGKGLWHDGGWATSAGGQTFAVRDPATGRPLADVADASPKDALQVAQRIVAAAPVWARTRGGDRAAVLAAVAGRLRAGMDGYAMLLAAEVGKPLPEARAEVEYAARYFEWFAAQALQVRGQHGRSPFDATTVTVQPVPVGPCLLIVPWNFPLAMSARKVAPALAAGCSFLLKPAEEAPLATIALFEDLLAAGLPAGVGGLVTTSAPADVVGAILDVEGMRKLSFTGSTAVGRSLAAAAGERLIRASMELGGNAPFLVFADADLDAAIEGAVASKLRNAGQACTASNRFYVHDAVHDEFTGRLAAELDRQVVGAGRDEGVTIGPLIDEAARSRVDALVADALASGATLLTDAAAPPPSGAFVRPALLSDLSPSAAILGQEIFGPVAPIVRFSAVDEALGLANSTDAGLVAYVYSSDPSTTARCVDALEVGMVGVNRGLVSDPAAPFGGIKASGFGREGGATGKSEYEEVKYIAAP